MKYFFCYILIIGGICLFNGCDRQGTPEEKAAPQINRSALKREINLIMLQDTSAQWLALLPKKYFDSLRIVYAECGYYPLWIDSFTDVNPIKRLLDFIGAAGDHGISPERYGYQFLISLFDMMRDTNAQKNLIDYKTLAKLETGLSLAFLQYEYDLCCGIVNQDSIGESNGDSTFAARKTDIPANLRSPARLETLESVQPKRPQYLALQQELRRLRKWEYDTTGFTVIPSIPGKIEKGKSSSLLPAVTARLKYFGLLDSSYHPGLSPVYDSALFNAVKKFQYRAGLLDDGVIGANTIEQLNITPRKRAATLSANLERLRWHSYPDSGNYILVNIPEFKLHAFRNGIAVHAIKVCTGQKRERNFEAKKAIYAKTGRWADKPKNFETPRVASRIYMIITNPSWSVPSSIAKNETFYEILKDSNFLAKKNFKVYKNGKQIDFTTVNWRKLSPANLQYDFIQDPGEANALGKIKFMFRNKYSIYLHDTPTRAPFQYGNRAVSHGCVRLEKPIELAEFLLDGNRGFNLDDIKCEVGIQPFDTGKMLKYKAKLNSGKKKATREFILDKPMPLYVDYFTAWADEDGQIRFAPDVYAKDQVLLNAMNRR